MEPLNAPTIEVVTCIPTSDGRLRSIGRGSLESPMKGVLAVAHRSWDSDVQQEHVDEAVEILLNGLTLESRGVGTCFNFESTLRNSVRSCHLFAKERDFHLSSVLWCFDGSLMKIGGIGWTFGWQSKHGYTTQVLNPTSTTISGAGPVLIASIGLGEMDSSKNNIEIPSSDGSQFCFSISSHGCSSHANCSASNRFLDDFGPDYLSDVERHQAMCILTPGSTAQKLTTNQ